MTDKEEVNEEVGDSLSLVENSIEKGNDKDLEAGEISSYSNSIESGTLKQDMDNSSSLISEPPQAESTLIVSETQKCLEKYDTFNENLSESFESKTGNSFVSLEVNKSVATDSFNDTLPIEKDMTGAVTETLSCCQRDEGNIGTETQSRPNETNLIQSDEEKLRTHKDVTIAGSLDHSEDGVARASSAQIESVENLTADLNGTLKKEISDSLDDMKAESENYSAQRDVELNEETVKVEKLGVPDVDKTEPEEYIPEQSDKRKEEQSKEDTFITLDVEKAKTEKCIETRSDILKEEASREENLIVLNVDKAETERCSAEQNNVLDKDKFGMEYFSKRAVEKKEPEENGADRSDGKNLEAIREVHYGKAESKTNSAVRDGIFRDEIPREENLRAIDVEDSDVEKYSNDTEYDIDQVRNYGTSILAIAESSRATRLQKRFQSGRTGMGKKTTDSNVTIDPLQTHSSIERDEGSTGSDADIKGAGATPQPTLTSKSQDIDEGAKVDKLQAATIRRDGIAVEPHSSDSGINHYKITLTKEMHEEIQREKLRIAEEEAQGGILVRVSKGVGSYLAQRRQRREQLALERKIAEANRALEEMRRASDSFESLENEEDIWGDLKVEIEPEPPTKFRHVPPILTKSMIAEFVKHYLPASLRLLKWKRIYSLSRDGDSFQTFLANVEKWQKTLLVVRTNREDLFGAFCDDAWGGLRNEMETPTYYGSGQSFLFKISKAKSEDVSFAPHNSVQETEQIVAFKWTGANRYVQLCDPNKKLIAMGGGGITGSFGLCLADDFSVGSSGPCETFGNEPLASQEHFDILDVEVWGFTTAF